MPDTMIGMESEAVARPVEETANFHLRRGVFRLYRAHDRAAFFNVEYVHRHVTVDSMARGRRAALV